MPAPFVHATAVVSSEAKLLGDGIKIWHFVHVDAGAEIGAETSVGQGCYIGAVTVGKRCRIQNHVSLYRGVKIEDDVFLGPSCVFTNVMHPRAHVNRKQEFASTVVKRGASVGANATIVCGNQGVTIGEYAFVGAGAVVTSDVAAFALMIGVPARQVGWVCECGEKLEIGLLSGMGASNCLCQRCQRRYTLSAAGMDKLLPSNE
jgi:UDP-2-acetamido-3-amino-2,3-dideoxy-glucuronate N-acetyltransferase